SGDTRYIDFKVRGNFIQGFHLAIFSDVTEKTLTAKALRNSEANLKAIFNNANQRFILLDNDYNIITFNESAQKRTYMHLGVSMEVGKSIFDYGKQGDRERMAPIYEKVKRGETVFVEMKSDYTNKEEYWMEI